MDKTLQKLGGALASVIMVTQKITKLVYRQDQS